MHMQAQRYVALVHLEKMETARGYGMTNFSGFVNQKLDEFIKLEREKIRIHNLPITQVK